MASYSIYATPEKNDRLMLKNTNNYAKYGGYHVTLVGFTNQNLYPVLQNLYNTMAQNNIITNRGLKISNYKVINNLVVYPVSSRRLLFINQYLHNLHLHLRIKEPYSLHITIGTIPELSNVGLWRHGKLDANFDNDLKHYFKNAQWSLRIITKTSHYAKVHWSRGLKI